MTPPAARRPEPIEFINANGKVYAAWSWPDYVEITHELLAETARTRQSYGYLWRSGDMVHIRVENGWADYHVENWSSDGETVGCWLIASSWTKPASERGNLTYGEPTMDAPGTSEENKRQIQQSMQDAALRALRGSG